MLLEECKGDAVIDDVELLVYSKEGNIDLFKARCNYEDITTEIFETSHNLSKLFSEWITDVESSVDSDLYRK